MLLTALQCKISSGMCSRSRAHWAHLLRSLQMDLWLHGAIKSMVVTALQCKISSGMCSRSRAHWAHLLRSWQMDLRLHGAIQIVVVTAMQCKISFWNSRKTFMSYFCLCWIFATFSYAKRSRTARRPRLPGYDFSWCKWWYNSLLLQCSRIWILDNLERGTEEYQFHSNWFLLACNDK